MGSVYEDQLESHKNVTSTWDVSEDGDISCGTGAVSRDSERNFDEFSEASSGFESMGNKRPTETGSGSFGRISKIQEEVTAPFDDHGGCRAAFDREVDTAECVSLAVDACGVDMDVYDADDLPTMRRRSRVDAEWICPRMVERSVG
ncbi:hypothetical protein HPB50_019621 [Hyalomma asiaticum]|uniref:Uncharacterized protein n=1 Tax=Hyalomma asiaticum TaxID=266040 RepID=A0ACB7RPL8_HYAAI|nr:hypothetical protein HPB50_019621 [Hyalomma asiaticum]